MRIKEYGLRIKGGKGMYWKDLEVWKKAHAKLWPGGFRWELKF